MRKEILDLTDEIIEELINANSLEEFNSVGIKNGKEIIHDFLENNEFGLAYEHLEYVVSECNISLNVMQKDKMREIAKKFK